MYYQLDNSGNILGVFANPQPQLDPTPILLEDPPAWPIPGQSWAYQRVGGEWVVSPQQAKLNTYNQGISAGYLVSPEGFTLGLQSNDIAQFTSLVTLLQEAKSLGMIDDNTPQIITDINGAMQTVATLRLRQIMVGYGLYYKNLKLSAI